MNRVSLMTETHRDCTGSPACAAKGMFGVLLQA
jgi:hypothetical protein